MLRPTSEITLVEGGLQEYRFLMKDKVIRLAIVEDDEGIRNMMRRVIARSGEFELAGAYEDGESALAGIPTSKPDVVVMDLQLPGMDGIACTASLRDSFPDLQILVLTNFGDSDHLFDALRAGASGYLLKRSSPEEILEAIHLVHEGGAPMSAGIARKVVDSFRAPAQKSSCEGLTPREETVLQLLAKGHLAKEVADILGISFTTARFHIRQIYKKLHVRSKTEAVLKYLGK